MIFMLKMIQVNLCKTALGFLTIFNSSIKTKLPKQTKMDGWMDGWMDDLQFYILFNSISVI